MDRQTFTPNIRRLGKGDVDEVLRLEGMCFAYRWNRDQFLRGLDAGAFHVLGMEQGGELIAYLAYSVVAREMEILNLAVTPDQRRQGLASLLLAAMLEDCLRRKVGHGFLEVRKSNQAAIDLYGKFGFKKVGERKKYYPDTGEDALVLRIDL